MAISLISPPPSGLQPEIKVNGVLKGDGSGNISAATATDIPGLSGKQEIVTGAATTITGSNLATNRALISNSSGKVAVSSVTSTELGYLDGVTSNIQTQLNSKLSSAPVTSVNSKTGAVSLEASDVGAVPTTRTVNKKALSANITLSATDVGALPTSGGTLTGNLTGKYITGTWLRTTDVSDKPGDIATVDSDGWIYKRTLQEAAQDITKENSIMPTSVELFPGANAGHGGHIDFHYNNNAADYTSRIIEAPSGYVQLNGMGIMTRANIAAVYNVQAQFTNGIFEYSNSVIKAGTICFAQFRGGLVSSSFRDTALSTSSEVGKVKIVAKNGETFNTNLNVLMINL